IARAECCARRPGGNNAFARADATRSITNLGPTEVFDLHGLLSAELGSQSNRMFGSRRNKNSRGTARRSTYCSRGVAQSRFATRTDRWKFGSRDGASQLVRDPFAPKSVEYY